jgi:hypothetical protein
MVIHSPNRSLPRYLMVRGTVMREAANCTTRAEAAAIPESAARRSLDLALSATLKPVCKRELAAERISIQRLRSDAIELTGSTPNDGAHRVRP